MSRYSHQFLIAVTVESAQSNPDCIPESTLLVALAKRLADIIQHDGREAFAHNDTEQI